jgi:hypothetical protein
MYGRGYQKKGFDIVPKFQDDNMERIDFLSSQILKMSK